MKTFCQTLAFLGFLASAVTSSAQNTCANDGQPNSDCDSEVGTNPINPYMGNLTRRVEDIRTFGPAPIVFKRHYNSRTLDFNDAYWQLGHRQTWQHNWNHEVRQLSTKTFGFFDIKVRYADGNEYNFKALDSSGSQLAPAADNGDRLYRWSGTQVGYTLLTANGREYDFKRYLSPKFALMQVRDGQGLYWNCAYDSTWRLISITNNFGRSLQLQYDGTGTASRITQVAASDGRTVTYNYTTWSSTGINLLASVNYPGGETASYTYASADPIFTGSRPVLATASDPTYDGAGSRMKYVYNYGNTFDYGAGAYLVTGTVMEERSLVTNQLVVALPGGTGPNPQIVTGEGGSPIRTFANGLISSKSDAVGRTTAYSRGAGGYGFINSTTEAATGATTFYTRDFAGRVLSQTDPLGHTRSFTYNAKGFLLSATDENGRITTYTRDAQSWLARQDHPDGTYETWTYNADGQPLTHRRRDGGVQTYVYYATTQTGGMKGDLQSTTDPLGFTTQYTWFPSGLMASVTDPRGHITSFTYNWRGQTLTRINPDSSVVRWTYDTFGNQLTQTNELGHITRWAYDEYNRRRSVTDPLSRTTSFEYGLEPGCTACGSADTVTRIISPRGKVTEFTYDLSHKRTSQTIGAGTADAATTLYAYDGIGDLASTTDPLGRVWTMGYDLLRRPVLTTDPLGHVTEQTFDSVGNVIATIRPDGGQTVVTYDAMDRVLTTTNPNNETTTFTYLPDGSMGTLTDARNHTYSFQADLLSRRTRMTYPDGSYEAWTYDADGNLSIYRTRSGVTKTCTYDTRDRDTLCDWSDSTPDVTKSYDVAGRLLTLNNSNSQLTYTYDAANQLTSETQDLSTLNPQLSPTTVTYSYDLDGNRASLGYPSGSLATYAYTARQQLATITVDGPPPLATYTYDKNGNRTAKSLENSTTAAYTYDEANRLLGLTHSSTAGNFASFSYTLDDVGNRVSRQSTISNQPSTVQTFQYDPTDQLTQVSYGSTRTTAFNYDPVGNRTSVTDSAGIVPSTYTANSLNQYTTVDTATPTYDANGNLTSSGGQTFIYDSENRLLESTISSSLSTVTNAYDARRRVVSRTVNGAITYFVWDGWSLIEERDSSGNEVCRYVHRPAVDEILIKADTDDTVYYHHDGLGSTVALTGDSGGMVESYTYDASGLPSIFDASSTSLAASFYSNRFLFTGREWVKVAEYYDYRHRTYSPQLGRFLQIDPIQFQAGDVNLYRYVVNNLVNSQDPLGLRGGPGGPPNSPNNGSAFDDFIEQYQNMREANYQNSDKYFHCMANCEAAKDGHSEGAEQLSETREWLDEHLKGDSKEDCDADREANDHGREAGENGEDCKSACDEYRPDGLPDKY